MAHTVYYAPDADTLTAAFDQATAHPMPARWRNALDAAYDLLLAADGIELELDSSGAVRIAHIPSETNPAHTYRVNGTCDCQAGQHGQPCKHRAAKRLLERARALPVAQLGVPARRAAARARCAAITAELFY